jgi:hypothetical protein
MRKIAILIATLAIFANLFYVFDPPTETGQGDTNDDPDVDENEDGLVESEITTLTVPEMKIGDQALYDYELFAQMFWENKTSGEWQRYTFTGEGELLHYIDDIIGAEDGYHMTRDSLKISFETRASFRMKIEGSDLDTATIPGTLDVKRSEYSNIFDEHALKAVTAGSLEIENLGSVFGSGSLPVDISYMADLKTYPDPQEDPALSMDDAIYAHGQTLGLNSKGVFEGEPVYGEEARLYDWQVEGAFIIQDHDTFKVNVTSDIWGFLYFNRQFYIADDYPFPLKGYTRTNSSYFGEEETFWIILETRQEIKDQDGSVQRGTKDIPWGDSSGHEEYIDEHPAGEFDRWNYVPSDGTDVDRSSFNYLTTTQAVDYAKANSAGLQEFLTEYEAKGLVLVEDSTWNRSTEDRRGRNTTYWWNLTFAYVYDMEEMRDYYETNDDWPEWRYRILVARSVEETLGGDPKISTFISRDREDEYHGLRKVQWSDGVNDETFVLDNQVLTLTHSEKIFRIDNKVKEETFENNKLTEGVKFYYGVVGLNDGNAPGMLLIEQLMGIQLPTADNAYIIQKDQVWTGGSTFSAAVESNTGRMVYVTSVEGSELASIFGG